MVGNFTSPRNIRARRGYRGGSTRYTKRARATGVRKRRGRTGKWSRARRGGRKRPSRRSKRGATPSSQVHGITSTSATRLPMIFKFEWLHTDENEVVTPERLYCDDFGVFKNPDDSALVSGRWNIMKVGDYTHFIDLVQRRGLYKEFKINKVNWQFYKDSAAHLGSSTQSSCHYFGAFDHRHSKIFRNPLMNALPNEPPLSQPVENDQEYGRYLTQSPGKQLDTINGLKASINCPARCISRKVLYAEGSNSVAEADEIPITTTIPFPWMSLERDLTKLPQVGEINTFIPMLNIRLDSNTNLPSAHDIGNAAAAWQPYFQEQVQKFGWFYRANIHWSVRGKHLEANLAGHPTAQEEIITID